MIATPCHRGAAVRVEIPARPEPGCRIGTHARHVEPGPPGPVRIRRLGGAVTAKHLD